MANIQPRGFTDEENAQVTDELCDLLRDHPDADEIVIECGYTSTKTVARGNRRPYILVRSDKDLDKLCSLIADLGWDVVPRHGEGFIPGHKSKAMASGEDQNV